MLKTVVFQQMDYILFLYGLAYVVLGAICFNLYREKLKNLPWGFMTLFACVHGCGSWIQTVSFTFGDLPFFPSAQNLFKIAAYLFLIEFARRTEKTLSGKSPGLWIYPLALAIVGISLKDGLTTFYSTARLVLNVTGGVWAGWAIYRAYQKEHSKSLFYFSASMIGFGLSGFFNVPSGASFPTSFFNQETISNLLGLPFQPFRALLVIALAFTIWIYWEVKRFSALLAEKKLFRRKFIYPFMIGYTFILVGGWVLTNMAGIYHDEMDREDIERHARTGATIVEMLGLGKSSGQGLDPYLANYALLRRGLIEVKVTDPRMVAASFYIQQNGEVIQVADGLPESDARHLIPGTILLDQPPELRAVFTDGNARVTGPNPFLSETYMTGYAAVRDPWSRQIIGVVGLNFDISKIQSERALYRLTVILLSLLTFLVFFELSIFRQNSWEYAQNIAAGQKRLMEAQEIARIGSWTVQGVMEPMIWSDEMYTIYGIPPGQRAPAFWELEKFLHPEDWDSFEMALGNIMQTQGEFKVEYRIIRPDGAVRHLFTRGTIRQGESENDFRVVGISQDITERKTADLQLRKLSQVIEQSPITVAITDLNGAIEYVNPEFCQSTGYTFEEALGQNPRILKSGETPPAGYCDLWTTIKSGQVWQGEFHNKKKNGDLYWEAATIFPVFSQNGEITNFAAVKENITARKLAEEALQAEQQLMQMLMDTIPDMIYFKDLESRFIRVNRAWADRLHISDPGLAIGKTDFDFFTSLHANQAYADEQAIIQTGMPLIHQEEVETFPDRPDSWVSTTKMPLRNRVGAIVGTFGISRDISEEKRAERELHLAHEELEKTNLELQKASQVKSEFLANMSHEIRTPLNAVIGMTSLLLDTPLTEEQQKFAGTVRTSGEVLLALINDILDFSKIEAQKMELENQSFDLRHCIEEALDLVATKAAEKSIELAYELDGEVPERFIGDVTRLRQILVNLLSNAVKFTETGEVVVSVSGQPAGDLHHQLQFSVRDTGIGIPPERVDRLFQSFSQVDASTTRRFGGTGLGLAISKRLSEMMGGTMWVESKGISGQGTTFHFTIFIAQDQSVTPKPSAPGGSELAGVRILIVDDNKTSREILSRYAIQWEMRPESVESGKAALDLLGDGKSFDLALLDYQMPGIDGVNLAHAIHKLAGCRNLPLILLSVLGFRETRADATFAAHLAKPIKPAQLYESLRLVHQHKSPAEVQKYTQKTKQFDHEMGRRHPLQVLLAEDNTVNQTVALSLLGRLGYRADIAANGIEVLDALSRQPYDLILMDVQMPEMDGIQATRWIRKQWPVEDQPRIVAMTANAMKSDRETYLAAGMDDYVSKPIFIEELVRILEECRCENQVSVDRVSQTEAVAVDLSVLHNFEQLLGPNGHEMVNNLVKLYLEDSPKIIAQMEQSLAADDWDAVLRSARTLKGNSLQIGAKLLAQSCLELETGAKNSRPIGVEKIIEDIGNEYQRASAILRDAFPRNQTGIF